MGQRANLVLVDEAGYRLFYCHWCANTLPEALFWGPNYAIPFILQQRAVEKEDGWLDEVWAEGGVIVDTGQHVLLLWGGEDILLNLPLRQAYLELLQIVWEGWTIRWLYEGIWEMADYVGLPRDKVQAPKPRSLAEEITLKQPTRTGWVNTIGSFVFEDQTLRLFPLLYQAEYCLSAGLLVIEAARNSPGLERLALEEWTQEFPGSGFHIDIPAKQVAFWQAHEPDYPYEVLVSRWPGWQVEWLKDNYQAQLEATRGRLTFPAVPPERLLDSLRSILLRADKAGSPIDVLKKAIADKTGHDVQVNPYALRDDPLRLSMEIKQQIFERAVGVWKRRHRHNP